MAIAPVGTLFGVPARDDASGSKLAVLGVPFDMGYHPTRIGARSGPAHVRANSALVAEHLDGYGIDLLERLSVVDLGDVAVLPGNVEESYPAIERAVAGIVAAGALPATSSAAGAVTVTIAPSEVALTPGAKASGVLLVANGGDTRMSVRVEPAEDDESVKAHVTTNAKQIAPNDSIPIAFRVRRSDEGSGQNTGVQFLVTASPIAPRSSGDPQTTASWSAHDP